MYISDVEKAKLIRKELKENGFKSKDFSITTKNSINIRIKNLSINKDLITKIVKKHESISRCEVTGEILSGGNTFVFVEYDYNTLREEGRKNYDISNKLLDNNFREGLFYKIFENDSINLYLIKEPFLELRVISKSNDMQHDKRYHADNFYNMGQALALIFAKYNIAENDIVTDLKD